MSDITVVIPFFNSEKTISDTIESVLNQDIGSFDVVLLNNCSTDSSISICKDFSSKSKSIPIKIIDRPENIGSFYNIYNAITLRQDGYLALLADDMRIENSYLRKLIINLERTNSILAYSGVVLHRNRSQVNHFDPYSLNSESSITRCESLISNLTLGTAIYGLYDSKKMSRIRRFWGDLDCVRLGDLQLLLSICAIGKVEQLHEYLIHRNLDEPTTNELYEKRLINAFNDRHAKNKLMFLSAVKSIYNSMLHYFNIEQSIYLANIVLKRYSKEVFFELSILPSVINDTSIHIMDKIALINNFYVVTALMSDQIGEKYLDDIKKAIGL